MTQRQRSYSFAIGLTFLAATARAAFAQSAPTSQPAPLLEQISQQTQALYESVRPSLLLVQLPPPKWLTAAIQQQQNQLMQKWGNQLHPNVMKRLQEEAQNGNQTNVNAVIVPATQPSATMNSAAAAEDREAPGPQGPRTLGVILDSRGYVLVPYFVEKEVVGNQALKVFLSPGHTSTARFIGSDLKTNLTLLKLDKQVGSPISNLGRRPAMGAMVMVLLSNAEAGQLLIWTGALQETGIVFAADGSLAGFTRGGQFLSGEQTRPVVEQLIQFGAVRRAVLGVTVRQLEGPAGQPAVQVVAVSPNTPAERSGLRVGDLITTFAGKTVMDVPSFAAAIAASDGPTEIVYLRNGADAPTKITVELRPQ